MFSCPHIFPSGKLTAYDTDGDGDFDVEDAKVLLGKSSLIFLFIATLPVFSQKCLTDVVYCCVPVP